MTAKEWLIENRHPFTPEVEKWDLVLEGYAVQVAGPLADCLERISVGGCIVDGDGTDPKCCAYCAAAVALATYRASVGRVRG